MEKRKTPTSLNDTVRSAILYPLSSILVLTSCDNKQAATIPTTAPVTVATATTKPSDTIYPPPQYPARPPAVMTLNGRDIAFPAAKLLVLGKTPGGLTVRLCSDDPPTSIDAGYTGNSFVFDMRLPVDTVAALPLAAWDFKSQSAPQNDDDTGIFLHGYRHEQLHPADVHITFQKDGDDILAYVAGNFLHVDTHNPIAPPETVQINACLRSLVSEH
jgi:hypothetical protein